MDSFVDSLKSALASPLPGIAAHNRMMSYNRPTPKEAVQSKRNPRESAVLILLYPSEGTMHTVLILRNAYEGVHSRQVGFPGGKKETYDPDLQATALREAQEEISINPKHVEVVGQLTELYIPPSNFIVQPFVGYTPHTPEFTPDPREVEKIIPTPLSRILHPDVIQSKDIFIPKYEVTIEAPYFDIDDQVVWGATAMILSELKEIITPLWKSGY